MKAITVRTATRKAPAYPNAASRRYFLNKFLDGALAVATGVATITAVVFLMLL